MAIYVDDKDLVAAHRAGDTEAFDQLARQYRPVLIRHAYSRLNCVDASEDAVQETMVRAYRALPKFDGEYKLGPWLHRILANVCVDEANRRKRDRDKAERLVSLDPRSSSALALSVEDELGFDVDHSALERALSDLPDSYREALSLKYVDELGYDEVANIAGVTEENARARVSRARTRMRASLKVVVLFPGLLVGVLRRGEKAAAASATGFTTVTASTGGVSATASTALGGVANAAPAASALMPTVAEVALAATQAAPTAIPVIAKAAVGLGLVAAVLTPTTDSAMHQVALDLVDGRSAISTQGVMATIVDPESPVVISSIALGSVTEPDITGSAAGPMLPDELLTEPNNLDTGSDSAVASGYKEDNTSTAGLGVDSYTAIQEIKLIGGSIEGASLKAVAGTAGRFTLVGSLNLTVGEVTILGEVLDESQMWVNSEEDNNNGTVRIDGSLVMRLADDTIARLRLAGFADKSKDGSDWKVSGLYRSTVSSLPLIELGSFSGDMNLDPQLALLALTLAS